MSNLILEKVTYKYRSSGTPAVSEVSCNFEPGPLC
jgi:energy-coupling factor transporter ATP-binding protein EcfA2